MFSKHYLREVVVRLRDGKHIIASIARRLRVKEDDKKRGRLIHLCPRWVFVSQCHWGNYRKIVAASKQRLVALSWLVLIVSESNVRDYF